LEVNFNGHDCVNDYIRVHNKMSAVLYDDKHDYLGDRFFYGFNDAASVKLKQVKAALSLE
jgi:hypothetical protein